MDTDLSSALGEINYPAWNCAIAGGTQTDELYVGDPQVISLRLAAYERICAAALRSSSDFGALPPVVVPVAKLTSDLRDQLKFTPQFYAICTAAFEFNSVI